MFIRHHIHGKFQQLPWAQPVLSTSGIYAAGANYLAGLRVLDDEGTQPECNIYFAPGRSTLEHIENEALQPHLVDGFKSSVFR